MQDSGRKLLQKAKLFSFDFLFPPIFGFSAVACSHDSEHLTLASSVAVDTIPEPYDPIGHIDRQNICCNSN